MSGPGNNPSMLTAINGPPAQGRVRVGTESQFLSNITILVFILVLSGALWYFFRPEPAEPKGSPETDCDTVAALSACLSSSSTPRGECADRWSEYCYSS
jgi:hypothetical protein